MAAEELRLHFFPARDGDAILIEDGITRVIVDMGRGNTGLHMLEKLVAGGHTTIDLLVVTHIDADHLEGVLEALPTGNLTVKRVWFNGSDHIDGNPAPRPHDYLTESAGQAECLTKWLLAHDEDVVWNGEKRLPLVAGFETTTIGEMGFTVLGPGQSQLGGLRTAWDTYMRKHPDGRCPTLEPPIDPPSIAEGEVGLRPDELTDRAQLEKCAGRARDSETPANLASIRLLLEWHGRRILLTGDGHTVDILDELQQLAATRDELYEETAPENGQRRLQFDLIKVPHHGSRDNMTQEFANAVLAPHWVISTDGSLHDHPNPESIARILLPKERGPTTIHFNDDTEFTRPWSDYGLPDRFGFATDYGTKTDGVLVKLAPRTP